MDPRTKDAIRSTSVTLQDMTDKMVKLQKDIRGIKKQLKLIIKSLLKK